jgi:hypothetical protein
MPGSSDIHLVLSLVQRVIQSTLLFTRLQRVQRLSHELAAQVFFFFQRQFGIAGDVDDTVS